MHGNNSSQHHCWKRTNTCQHICVYTPTVPSITFVPFEAVTIVMPHRLIPRLNFQRNPSPRFLPEPHSATYRIPPRTSQRHLSHPSPNFTAPPVSSINPTNLHLRQSRRYFAQRMLLCVYCVCYLRPTHHLVLVPMLTISDRPIVWCLSQTDPSLGACLRQAPNDGSAESAGSSFGACLRPTCCPTLFQSHSAPPTPSDAPH